MRPPRLTGSAKGPPAPVFVVTPGGTATEMIDAWKAVSPGITERNKAAPPLGRMAEPREVAEAATWLLSGGASGVTGAMVPVDGSAGAGAPPVRRGAAVDPAPPSPGHRPPSAQTCRVGR